MGCTCTDSDYARAMVFFIFCHCSLGLLKVEFGIAYMCINYASFLGILEKLERSAWYPLLRACIAGFQGDLETTVISVHVALLYNTESQGSLQSSTKPCCVPSVRLESQGCNEKTTTDGGRVHL